MYDEVLVPTDGSDAVEDAVEHALHVAGDDATVHALYVVDRRITTAAGPDHGEEVRTRLEEEGAAALDAVATAAEDAGLETVRETRHGTPHKEILAYADEAGVDLVVLGSHGKTAREKLTSLGSVSERVVDGATVPTLVVRSEGAGAE